MRYFYVCVRPWAVYVKTAPFFRSQGGMRAAWGKHWRRVRARSIEHARAIGEARR